MNHLLLLSFLFLLHSATGYTQTASLSKKWTMQHATTKEKKTFTAKHWMQITWREHDSTQSIKAKLYRLDNDSVAFKSKKTRVTVAREDVIKVRKVQPPWSWAATIFGAIIFSLGLLGASYFGGAAIITRDVGGSSSRVDEYTSHFKRSLVILGLGLGLAIIGRDKAKTQITPFGKNWQLQEVQIDPQKTSPSGNQFP